MYYHSGLFPDQKTPLNTKYKHLVRVAVVAGFLVTGMTNAYAGSTLDRIKQTGTVNLGYRTVSLPFSYKSEDAGAPLGYSVDVCNALVEAIKVELKNTGLQVKYLPVTSAERFDWVRDGKIDFECANSTNTKVRREKVAFAMPLYFSSAKLLVRDGSGIASIADLDGKTLSVEKGTTGEQIIESRKKTLSNMKVVFVESSLAGAKTVEDKTADAFITDDILLYGFKAQSKEALDVVGPVLTIEPLTIAFSKDDPELAVFVEREMTNLYMSGKMRRWYKKWFQTQLPQRQFSMNVPANQLTADMFNHPSGYAVDWVVF